MLRSLVLVVLLVVPAAPAHAAWRAPVRGPVAARFHYTRAHPYAAGQRRGADFAAAAGAPVVAPCTGRVTFAGRVPGRGAGAALRCGALAATVLGLGGLAVQRGQLVLGGARLGSAASGGVVRLGARRAADRYGYVDPLALLGAADRPPTLVPRAVGPGVPPSRGGPLPAPARVRFAAGRTGRTGRAGAPATAWAGLALLATALGTGVVRRRHLVPRPALASREPCPSTSPRPFTT